MRFLRCAAWYASLTRKGYVRVYPSPDDAACKSEYSVSSVFRTHVESEPVHRVSGAVVLFLLTALLRAQSTSAGLAGRVTDPSQALIANAQVAAIRVDTNARLMTLTNASGEYQGGISGRDKRPAVAVETGSSAGLSRARSQTRDQRSDWRRERSALDRHV